MFAGVELEALVQAAPFSIGVSKTGCYIDGPGQTTSSCLKGPEEEARPGLTMGLIRPPLLLL